MLRHPVTLHVSGNPAFFFDVDNTRHLPRELFLNYMRTLQVLCLDRLGESFTGNCRQMRLLQDCVTVFDFFVVTTALQRDPQLAQDTDALPRQYPQSYEEWVQRIYMSRPRDDVEPHPVVSCDPNIDAAPTEDDSSVGVPDPVPLETGDVRAGGPSDNPVSSVPQQNVAGDADAGGGEPSPPPVTSSGETGPVSERGGRRRRSRLTWTQRCLAVSRREERTVSYHSAHVVLPEPPDTVQRFALRYDSLKCETSPTGLDFLKALSFSYVPESVTLIERFDPDLPMIEDAHRWRGLPAHVYTTHPEWREVLLTSQQMQRSSLTGIT